MPPVISAIGWALANGAAVGSVAFTVGSFLMAAAEIIGGLLLLLGASALNARAKRKARDQYNASQIDRLVTVQTTTAPRELVLGTVRKGGLIAFRKSTGPYNATFYVVIVVASHASSAIRQVYFNDTPVALDGSGWVRTAPYDLTRTVSRVLYSVHNPNPPGAVPGTVEFYSYDGEYGTTYQELIFDSKARVWWHLGSDTQTADATLMAAFPGVWTSAHRLQGLTYLVCEFHYDETAFPSGIPTVTVEMDGAIMPDPRTGLQTFSRNPAVHGTYVLQHPYFGKRSALTTSETARFVAAANACDTSYTPTGGAAGPLYASDCVLAYGAETAGVLDDLTQACCGAWAYAGGEIHFKAGVYSAPVKYLTGDDLATQQSDSDGGSTKLPVVINTHRARADKINVVTPRIWDRNQEYKAVALDAVKNTEAITDDGVEIAVEVGMTAVSGAAQARVIANYLLKESRDPLGFTASFKLTAFDLEMFDTINFTEARYGWASGKDFLILGKSTTADGLIQLTMRETSAELFNPAVAANSDGYASNTDLMPSWDISPPAITLVESSDAQLIQHADGTVVTRVKVTWEVIDDIRILQGGNVEVQWKPAAEASWQTLRADAADTYLYIVGPKDETDIIIRLRVRTKLAVSDWAKQVKHTVVGKSAPPDNVTVFTVSVVSENLLLRWGEVANLDTAGYEVRTADSNWGLSGELFRGDSTSCQADLGSGIWYIKAFDTTGHYSTTAKAVSFTAASVPNVSGITHVFADTSLTAATVTLSWALPSAEFGIRKCQISFDSELVEALANTVTLPANWIGSRVFTVKAVDGAGAVSTGVSYPVTKLAPSSALNFRAQVIDNNILLYWQLPAKTSLPISHSLLKKGATWATATSIGTKDGEFTTISELQGGTYVYWLAVVDTDGYESVPVSLSTSVSQPPDFVFNIEWRSLLDSVTRSNAFTEGENLYLPVNVTESQASHFTTPGWAGPDAQIAAGYPFFIQPALTTGYYEEVFDYGTALASSSVTVDLAGAPLAGTCATAVVTSISLDGVTYTDYPGLTNIYAINFRYVKFRLTITQASAGAVYKLDQLTIRLDSKLKSDAGSVLAESGDSLGTIVNFNTPFVDVIAINASVAGTASRIAVYDFKDAVIAGTYTVVSNVITVALVAAHDLVAGQKVRLAPSSGTMPIGVYTIATVPNTTSYTLNAILPNTSGNLTTYANSFRVYVFDTSGVRQTNTVSCTIRGS